MARLEVGRARYMRDESGYSFATVSVNGHRARISIEQRNQHRGVVYLGGVEDDPDVVAVIPADPEDGRSLPVEIPGGTRDPRILAIYDELQRRDRGGGKLTDA